MQIVLVAALAGVLGPVGAADRDHPLAALADRAAEEITRVAAGRPIQLDMPEDTSGVAGGARDLQTLLQARLRERLAPPSAPTRVRVTSVLGRSSTRLRLVGRATVEPGGDLVDVFAVSVDADPDVLALLSRPAPAARAAVSVAASALSAPLPGRVLDVAFVDDERLLVLLADALVLYRRTGATLTRLDQRPLDVTAAVRAPAGIILATPGESAGWVATNLAEGAVLFSVEGDRLHETQRAPVFPLPGVRRGARFQPGTNLIEVEIPALGDGPHLRVGGGKGRWAIAGDGRLGFAGAGWTETRVGSAAADLWPGTMVTTSNQPPGSEDAIAVWDFAGLATLATIPVAGSVSAVGARARDRSATIAAGVDAEGASRLLLVELTRAE